MFILSALAAATLRSVGMCARQNPAAAPSPPSGRMARESKGTVNARSKRDPTGAGNGLVRVVGARRHAKLESAPRTGGAAVSLDRPAGYPEGVSPLGTAKKPAPFILSSPSAATLLAWKSARGRYPAAAPSPPSGRMARESKGTVNARGVRRVRRHPSLASRGLRILS